LFDEQSFLGLASEKILRPSVRPVVVVVVSKKTGQKTRKKKWLRSTDHRLTGFLTFG